MKKIQFGPEGVEALLGFAQELQNSYDAFAAAGNRLIQELETYKDAIGYDSEMVADLINRLDQELTQNSKELIELYEYCKGEAEYMASLL